MRYLQAVGAALLMLASLIGFASPNSNVSERTVRDNLIGRFYGQPGYVIGIFPGYTKGTDIDSLVDRYLPLVNRLTIETKIPFVFLPEKDKTSIAVAVSEKRYPIMLINPEQSVGALNAGYTPVVRQSEGIRPAFVVRKDSGITRLADLAGKKVGAVLKANVTTLFRYAAKTEGVTVSVDNLDLPQNQLSNVLTGKTYSAVVLRDTFAKLQPCVKAGNCDVIVLDAKYSVPGFFLMVDKKRLPESLTRTLTDFFLRLSPSKNPDDLRIVSGFDISDPAHLTFEPATEDDLTFQKKATEGTKGS